MGWQKIIFRGRVFEVLFLLAILAGICTHGTAAAQGSNSASDELVIDEGLWLVFYDLPSRRFRIAKTRFVQKDYQEAIVNLEKSASFMLIEAERAEKSGLPKEELTAAAGALRALSDRMGKDLDITLMSLNEVFAKSHEALSSHFLKLAVDSRDRKDWERAGHYLWAAAHHYERRRLYSSEGFSNAEVKILDKIRRQATRLTAGEPWKAVAAERPMKLMEAELKKLKTAPDNPRDD